jgi:hypothetical protein
MRVRESVRVSRCQRLMRGHISRYSDVAESVESRMSVRVALVCVCVCVSVWRSTRSQRLKLCMRVSNSSVRVESIQSMLST